MPETSIIIRTFNEEKYIGDLLSSIQRQKYSDVEVLIVDSGSSDRTLEIASQFPVKIISIESRDFTFGYSLNVGCEEARGAFLVLVSAHVIPVNENWLSYLLAPLKENDSIAMVYGRQMGTKQSKFSEQMDFKRLFSTLSVNSAVPLNYANNANAAIRRSLWLKQPFDEYLFGLEDIDWAQHMVDKNYSIQYAPKAAIYHIHEERWYQVFNRYRREAIAAVRMGLSEPPQAGLTVSWVCRSLLGDFISTFPNYSRSRIEEIIRFRYFQWKGSNIGWKQGAHLDFKREKNNIFYPEENRAVVIKGPQKAVMEEMLLPEMKPGDVLVKVDYVGVCRTDLEVYEGTLGYYKDMIARYPIVPGHEFSGTIAKIGSNNRFQERFQVGQRIVGECILSRGKEDQRKEVGVVNYNGAYSKHIIIPGDAIHKIPAKVDSKTAVLTEPLAAVLRALRRIESRLLPSARILVVGAGQIGNLCSQVLTLQGYNVTICDTNSARLDILSGVISTVSTALPPLEGFDTVIDATGSRTVLEKILHGTVVDSTILLLGFPYGEIAYNFEDIVGNEKVVIGSVGADEEDFVQALQLLPKLEMEPFTRIVMSLEDFEKAWNAHKNANHLKILLRP